MNLIAEDEEDAASDDVTVISITGGLPDNDGSRAGVGDITLHREPDETFETFRDRAVAAARAAGEKFVVIGALPDDDAAGECGV